MFDVITFGSATNDIFLRLRKEHAHTLKNSRAPSEHNLCVCVPFGSKILVEDLEQHTGGGGANTACSFSSLGLKAAYMGKVGDDEAGQQVEKELKCFKVDTCFLKKDEKLKTALSIILSPKDGERTILVYHGACHFLGKAEVDWRKIRKTKWFYIAPLYQTTGKLLMPLIEFAQKNKIKIAINPSRSLLEKGLDFLRPALQKADAALLNREEANLIGGVEKITQIAPGIVAITKGREGVDVYYQGKSFEAAAPDVQVIETTGAGDAFGSGFLAGLLLKDNIEYAIQLGLANAVSCIQKIGAKAGLLKKADLGSLPRVRIKQQ